MLYILVFLVLLLVGIILFLNLSPTFGGNPSREQKELYKDLNNYSKGKFVNEIPTSMGMGFVDILSMLKDSFAGGKERSPQSEITVESINWDKIKAERNSITWLGHSSFLLSIDNKKILVDPMLGNIASPVSFVGSKKYRYSESMEKIFNEMVSIDAVFISHDHYDHLDYKSIVKLKDKVSHFFVPLGVGSHLIRWGVSKEKITEVNWWNEIKYKNLTIALVPSRHFSGRGIFNSNTTLWGGWVIIGENIRLYISGDGGYGPHFKKIGEKYGSFDLTLIEGAQYDRRWANIHMLPEQAVKANLDLRGKKMMLMHWGAFTLAFHGWSEPIERALLEAKKSEVNLVVPKIGKTLFIDSELNTSICSWWK